MSNHGSQEGIGLFDSMRMQTEMRQVSSPQYQDAGAARQLNALAAGNKQPGSISGQEMANAIINGTKDLDGQAAGKEFKDIAKFVKENEQLLSPEAKRAFATYESAVKQAEKLRETKLQFDYRTDSRDRALNKEDQKIYGLAEGEPILSSGASDLDYALLPVDGSPGGDQVATRFGTVPRGWLLPVKHNIEIDSVIFILQHPHGDYLGVAVDRVTKVTANRVQYRTNTNVGSSGSPCFNQDWELVALHHAGENSARPTWNQGIPFKAILARQEVSDAIARNTDRV